MTPLNLTPTPTPRDFASDKFAKHSHWVTEYVKKAIRQRIVWYFNTTLGVCIFGALKNPNISHWAHQTNPNQHTVINISLTFLCIQVKLIFVHKIYILTNMQRDVSADVTPFSTSVVRVAEWIYKESLMINQVPWDALRHAIRSWGVFG